MSRDRQLTMDYGVDYEDVEVLYDAYKKCEIRIDFDIWYNNLRCVKEKDKYFWYDGLKLVAITLSS